MQIRKTYREVNPELLFYEIRDFVRNHGAAFGEAKLETFSLPTDSSSFISRGTLTFHVQDPADKMEKECLRARIVGSARSETKLMLDFADGLFPKENISALQADLDFIFGSQETRPEKTD